MEIDPNTKRLLEIGHTLLENDDHIKRLCQIPRDSFGEKARGGLAELHKYYNPPRPRGTGPQSKRSKRMRGDEQTPEADDILDDVADTTDRWKTFRIIDKLDRPSYIDAFFAARADVEGDETDAEAFMVDSFQPEDQLGANLGPHAGGQVSNVLDAHFEYTARLMERSAMDRARQCFSWIAWYDLVKMVRPDITGARLGNLVKEDVGDLLHHYYGHDEKRIDYVWTYLNIWVKWGMKLNDMQETHGQGCIFILSHKLSSNFLQYKFSTTGDAREKADNHLRKLGLPELASEHDVHALAIEIRKFMLSDFPVDLVAQIREHRARRR